MSQANTKLKYENLAFYWRLAEPNASANIVPDTMSFEFGFRPELQLIKQELTKEITEYLETIYKAEYNIGYLQDINSIAKPYGTDLINYIFSLIDSTSNSAAKPISILEIGCGGCVVLEALSKQGHKVMGVDPSPIAIRAGQTKSIKVVEDFFPSKSVTENFDLIFHADVLEHVEDPVAFLKTHRDNLKTGGLVLTSVPDCTESIEIGDPSMIIHQHINYFDTESLRLTFEAAGYEVVKIDRAKYGGSLYCVGKKLENPAPKANQEADLSTEKFDTYIKGAINAHSKFNNWIHSRMKDTNKSIGLYVPLRALPYLEQADIRSGFRFFDDTEHWHNCNFDSVNVAIENRSELIAKPVTDLLIMSLTFGEVIKQKVKNENSNIEITLLKELIN